MTSNQTDSSSTWAPQTGHRPTTYSKHIKFKLCTHQLPAVPIYQTTATTCKLQRHSTNRAILLNIRLSVKRDQGNSVKNEKIMNLLLFLTLNLDGCIAKKLDFQGIVGHRVQEFGLSATTRLRATCKIFTNPFRKF